MYHVISAKVARQASDRFASETGWLVLDLAGRIIYRMKIRSEACAAADRLNRAAAS